jgi:hypothetical protein
MPDTSNSTADNQSVEHAENWLEESGKPSRETLYKFAESDTPEDWETLRNLAAKHSVNNYGDPANMIELTDKIAQAINEQDSSGSM